MTHPFPITCLSSEKPTYCRKYTVNQNSPTRCLMTRLNGLRRTSSADNCRFSPLSPGFLKDSSICLLCSGEILFSGEIIGEVMLVVGDSYKKVSQKKILRYVNNVSWYKVMFEQHSCFFKSHKVTKCESNLFKSFTCLFLLKHSIAQILVLCILFQLT